LGLNYRSGVTDPPVPALLALRPVPPRLPSQRRHRSGAMDGSAGEDRRLYHDMGLSPIQIAGVQANVPRLAITERLATQSCPPEAAIVARAGRPGAGAG